MRIVAGEFSSRKIETLAGNDTRPTLDKVREAVFSSLGTYFDGGTFLDLYAGSGAVGLEALSRGMDFCIFCEKNRDAVSIIKKNIASLKVEERSKVYPVSAGKLLHLLKDTDIRFDLVYLDPPYRQQENEKMILFLCENSMLNGDARIVIESLKEDSYPEKIGDMIRYKSSVYGITKITYYRKEETV